MDRPFRFNDVAVLTPDSFKPAAATTSTDDSGRTQDFVMRNVVIGTVESYSIEWKDIPTKEAALIYNQIRNQQEYKLRYMSLGTGEWEEDIFYTNNYECGTLKQVNGKDAWESFSFNAIRVYPV